MFKDTKDGVIISLHVIPNAGKSEVIGKYNEALKVKIQAPPVDGKANEAIVDFFAKAFKISKSKISMLKGDKAKTKSFLIHGVSKAEAELVLKF